jgi:hypothetical protein
MSDLSKGLRQEPPPLPFTPPEPAELTPAERHAAVTRYLLSRYAWPADPIAWAAARYERSLAEPESHD